MTRWLLAVFSVLGALLWLPGCAAVRQQALYEKASDFIYPQPLEEVWPQVQRFVNDHGYPARNDPDHFVIVTDWRSELRESRVASSSSRLFVAGYRLNRGNCVVRIFRHTLMTGNKGPTTAQANIGQEVQPYTSDDVIFEDAMAGTHRKGAYTPLIRPVVAINRLFSRDLALEWELLQQLAPEQARELMAHVDAP